MKRLILTIAVLCCASSIYAQSPCEKAYNKAHKLYEQTDYSAALEQFKLVLKDCDSYDEAAELGIKLCEVEIEKNKLKETNNQLVSDNKKLKSQEDKLLKNKKLLESEIKELKAERDNYKLKNAELRGENDKWSVEYQLLENRFKNYSKDTIVVNNTDTIYIKDRLVYSKQIDKLQTLIKEVDGKIEEYINTSGFKNWLNSKKIKEEANKIRESISEYIRPNDTIKNIDAKEEIKDKAN